MTQLEKELYKVWNECDEKTRGLNEKYKNDKGLDGHMLEYKQIIMEADRKAQEIKKKYKWE